MQPEYLGTRWTKFAIYTVPMDQPENVLSSFLGDYKRGVEVTSLRGGYFIVSGDYFLLLQNREDFQAIPDAIQFKNQQIIVVEEVKRSHCWPD